MDIKQLPSSVLRPDGANASPSNKSVGAQSDRSRSIANPIASSNEDMLTLTAAAQSMNATRNGASTEGPFDEGRVAQIRQAIDEGRYTVDNRQLADRIIGFEQALA